MKNTRDSIRAYLASHGALPAGAGAELDDIRLLDSLKIDSLMVVRLVTFLEKEFAMRIPAGEISAENFQSISSMASLVERCGAQK